MGLQVCPLPTAILSTQTDGFEDFLFRDLTDSMVPYLEHWKRLGMTFDCVYSGFLGSARQIDIVSQFIEACTRSHPLIVVDPVMGDAGCLYSTYTPELIVKMRSLVEKADVTTPNLTEAYFLLSEPCEDRPLNISEIEQFLTRISDIGPRSVVITSVRDREGQLVNAGYDRTTQQCWTVPYDRVPVNYPGTGDIFASILTGYLLRGDELHVALDRATRFLSHVVATTYAAGTPRREGVLLEKALPLLWPSMGARITE